MRKLITIAAMAMLATPSVHALEGFSTCHAAGTTATSVSGIDTRTAKMVSVMTHADAVEACHRNEQRGSALKACADKLMKNGDTQIGEAIVWARQELLPCNIPRCVSPLIIPASEAFTSQNGSFPVTPMCADDNDAAIAAFHTLCPSYKGRVEKDD
jgi:hypothetical protein